MSTFVLVHGAFQGKWVWRKINPMLQQLGHKVITFDLPGHGRDDFPQSKVTLKSYTDRLCHILDEAIEPVILVGHSMGGMIMSQAAEYRPHKIKKLIFLAAMVPKNGETLMDINQQDQHALPLPVSISEDQRLLEIDASATKEHFFAACTDEDTAEAQKKLCNQALEPFVTPVQLTDNKFNHLPKIYIETLMDQAISIDFQRELQNKSSFEKIYKIPSDHSPFFSYPDELVSILDEIA
ncbi:alpha/beta hydrolase [Salinibacillus xinjiangensis]|uniref:alpha/beta hydrolase n=1 Tax=Salinibacillus xinjiangensis TaxID=1229268 RepID=UPI001891A3F3|nr:alpha/beta hydrolase [Salinibacillus xinjiangensis]